jgi:hypothetical protein
MTTFALHRATVESFVDCMHGGADKDTLARILAENVVLIGPLSDEPLTGREAVTAAIQGGSTLAADLTYKEVLSGETHHAAFFRLQIEDTAVNGMDYILFDADGKIAEVTIFWRPLPSAVEMQGHLAPLVGMQPWELRTKGEYRSWDALVPCPWPDPLFCNGGRFTIPTHRRKMTRRCRERCGSWPGTSRPTRWARPGTRQRIRETSSSRLRSQSCSTRGIEHTSRRADEVRSVSATSAYRCSSPRSNHGQTILKACWTTEIMLLTCTDGRDGEIRTRGLLLPKQAR